MNKNDISTFVHFNFWANGRLLAACEQLTPEEFKGEITPNSGWGSLREILVHILDTEYGWRSILQAQEANRILEAADFEDVVALKTRWDIEQTAWIDYVTNLKSEEINQSYGQDSHSGLSVWQTIMHVVTHGIQHRSEAAFILTDYGYSPGELDFDIFLREKV